RHREPDFRKPRGAIGHRGRSSASGALPSQRRLRFYLWSPTGSRWRRHGNGEFPEKPVRQIGIIESKVRLGIFSATLPRDQLNSLFNQRMIVGRVSGVWPMWPPGKTRADFGVPYSRRMLKILNRSLEVFFAVNDQ